MENKFVTANDLYEYQFPHDICCAPEGGALAFLLSEMDAESDGYRHDICLLNPDGTYRRLTRSGDIKAFRWLNEKELIFQYTSSSKGENCIYKLSLENESIEKLFSIPVQSELPSALSLSKWMINAKRPAGSHTVQEDRAAEGVDYWSFTDVPFIRNGENFTSTRRTRLGIFDETSGDIRYITGKYYETAGWDISPDKKYILYYGEDYSDCRSLFHSLYIYNIENGQTDEVIGGGKYQISIARWLDCGQILLHASLLDRSATQNHDLYLLNPGNRDLRRISSPDGMYSSLIDVDTAYGGGQTVKISGNNMTAIRLKGTYTALDEVDGQTGEIRQITLVDALTSFDTYGDYCYGVVLENHDLPEIYRIHIATGEKTKLTDFSGKYLSTHKISMPEFISFTAKNGETVEGYIIPPADFDGSRKYPGVLYIHGGPKWAYSKTHMHLFQCIAAKGMYVFYCNPHGSDGYGERFLEMVRQWGRTDYDHLMEFTDECLRRYPNLDKARLGVTGGSYGGYMTNWIIGHTGRFRAAVSQRSISNLVTTALISDLGERVMKQACGDCTPWKDEEILWEHSPLKYAKNVTTPTLFLHSDKDYRCFMGEAFQMFTAIKQAGAETEMYLFHGDAHSLSRSGKPSHRIVRVETIIKWFEKYL